MSQRYNKLCTYVRAFCKMTGKKPKSDSVFFLLRMYPSILSFETINKLKLFFECGIPRPQDVGHLRLCYFLTHFIISIALLENVPPDAGLQTRATFSTLNIGLPGTGNRTRATCVASSGFNRLAIHYAYLTL
jgi:hypothetical protein